MKNITQNLSGLFQTAFKNEIQNGINYNTALKRSIANTLQNESIIDILNKGTPSLSFEVFPPKTEDGFETVEE